MVRCTCVSRAGNTMTFGAVSLTKALTSFDRLILALRTISIPPVHSARIPCSHLPCLRHRGAAKTLGLFTTTHEHWLSYRTETYVSSSKYLEDRQRTKYSEKLSGVVRSCTYQRNWIERETSRWRWRRESYIACGARLGWGPKSLFCGARSEHFDP